MAKGGTVDFRFDARNLLMLSRRIDKAMRTEFNAAVKSVHAEAALRIQGGMVEELQERVKRTGRLQRGTDFLEISLMDRRNASVTQRGFEVLRPTWMSRSPSALYWRRIEEGDQTTFSGYILFTNDFRKFRGPGRSEGDMRMPQHRGVYVQGIGPFPAYHYTDGGARALRNFPFMVAYRKALASVGLNIQAFVR